MTHRVLGKRISALLRSYYRGPDHVMKLRLWHWVWSRMGSPRLTVRYAERGWITLDIEDWLQGIIFREGYYEREVWDGLAAHAATGEIVWDVGAHIGSFAIRAGIDPRVAEVHAFEPDPLQGDILSINLPLNIGRYSQHALALSSRNETRKLYHGLPGNTGLSSLSAAVTPVFFEVQCRTIDDLVFKEKMRAPTLIKIDVEGWELSVLQGAERVLSECPPKAMVLEFECDGTGTVTDQRLLDLLHRAHFQVERISRPSGVIDTRENYLALYRKAS